ncbi:lysylphosphatidylglycerol synthase transmembrane domain-containing protein [Vibrio barjaei]|uniref:lysylphosphatidylglycerol synthase transmembrane domain-containing protein n=1 Tax=Vibrio barjaei TaxID=1676683 RepID=UPI0022840589|nr:lysylphosphatidylglycerol synthase transmembrane domain-containing protein [Vibrio barjaei]MCY9872559.1 lysylphosphatidylglycerol synthase transmembrane domain-containing protein [Vibrio barjaei]
MGSRIVRKRSFVFAFCIISLVYILGVIVLDEQLNFDILDVIKVEDVVLILSLFTLSIFSRYVRWHLLMLGHGISHHFSKGFFFYVAGFAYTATPGKVGELSRIVHYRSVGVSSDVVISSFIIERFFDLVVVLVMASAIFILFPQLWIVAFAIIVIIGVIFIFTANIHLSKGICRKLVRVKSPRLARFSCLVYKVLLNINQRLSLKVSLSCLLLGVAAWTCTSFILVYSCYMLGIDLPYLQLISVYPTAMLAGAVSFVPGGVGATEAVIVFILNKFEASIPIASTVALLVRFSTLWLAVLVGGGCSLVSAFLVSNR